MSATPGHVALAALTLGLLTSCEQPPDTAPRVLKVEPGCDPARRACSATGDGVGITLRLEPARALTPFPVHISVQGMVAEAVSAEFSMPGMDMGRNRYHLEHPGKEQDGEWQARVMLPACRSGRRDWVTLVTAVRGNESVEASFPFRLAE